MWVWRSDSSLGGALALADEDEVPDGEGRRRHQPDEYRREHSGERRRVAAEADPLIIDQQQHQRDKTHGHRISDQEAHHSRVNRIAQRRGNEASHAR